MNEQLFDINTVCRMLGTTSRTLRFYEEKHLITSTKTAYSNRRQYTPEQIDLIRNVLVLRTIGLSIKDIVELQMDGTDLKSAVLSRCDQVYTQIDKKNREINLLNEALAVIESGGDVYQSNWMARIAEDNSDLLELSQTCAEAIISGDSEALYSRFGKLLREHMTFEEFEHARSYVLEPLGEFVRFDGCVTDSSFPNIVHQKLRYQKLGLNIKFVFHNAEICGLWFSYYN